MASACSGVASSRSSSFEDASGAVAPSRRPGERAGIRNLPNSLNAGPDRRQGSTAAQWLRPRRRAALVERSLLRLPQAAGNRSAASCALRTPLFPFRGIPNGGCAAGLRTEEATGLLQEACAGRLPIRPASCSSPSTKRRSGRPACRSVRPRTSPAAAGSRCRPRRARGTHVPPRPRRWYRSRRNIP